MKTLVLVASFLLGISGYFIQIPTNENMQFISDRMIWVRNEKNILNILQNICEETAEANIKDKNFEHLTPEDITTINYLLSTNLVPKQKIFSELNDTHISELKKVYEILMGAKDREAFYELSGQLRNNLNCALFLSAFYAALLHRSDMEKFMIPPPYEILPNYFIRKETILNAISVLSGYNIISSEDITFNGSTYILNANYTSDFYENKEEPKLAYFLEDVGLNAYYFMQHLRFAPWMYNGSSLNINGVEVYHMLKQLVARYELERYANGFAESESLDLDKVDYLNYDPMLIYSNGKDFPRQETKSLETQDEYRAYLKNMEDNIITLTTHLRQTGYNKSEVINHLIEILLIGERSYEKVAIRILKAENNTSIPSVLEHYMTKLRVPVYWQLLKKILHTIERGLSIFEGYTRDEIYCPGMEIFGIEVKKMITYYDVVTIDATNGLKFNMTQVDAKVMIQQPRLNHKEFSIKLNISSLINQKVLIKVYLSPLEQLNAMSSKWKKNIIHLHSFETDLKSGKNILSLSSNEMNYLREFPSIKSLFKTAEDVEYGLDEIKLRKIEYFTEFPSNLILPKGSDLGLGVKLLVFVGPFSKPKPGSPLELEFNSAILSPGYPFDSNMDENIFYNLPNFKVKEVHITHKGENKVIDSNGVSKKWYKNNYDPSSRPTYDYTSKKGAYDYASKKGVYDYNSKKNQYSTKKYVSDDFSTYNPEFIINETEMGVKPLNSLEVDHETKNQDVEIQNYEKKLQPKFQLNAVEQNILNDAIDGNDFEDSEKNLSHTISPTKEEIVKKPTVFDYLGYILDEDSSAQYKDKVYE